MKNQLQLKFTYALWTAKMVGEIISDRFGVKLSKASVCREGVLWILNTGAQWHMLPQCYPNYKTIHRRFQQW